MSRLTIYSDDAPSVPQFDSRDAAQIAQSLREVGVRFERWDATCSLSAAADSEAILKAYEKDVGRLTREGGYRSVDVMRCLPDNPNKAEMRAKFLSEHIHDDDEVRFFVEGAGVFYLHLDGKVYMTLCERNDLIAVPAGTRHWFDMGAAPHFTVIRLFTRPDGWVAKFTGDAIASRFPEFDRRAA
jgi:1,2-dihydroxy-3-keto-5-methylthiopentene dioxygenase